MKVMAIIGIVWFSLSILCIGSFQNSLNDEAVGWGYLGLLYAIPFSIVVLVQTNKKEIPYKNVTQELLKLSELKEKGILSEEEFQTLKFNLFRK